MRILRAETHQKMRCLCQVGLSMLTTSLTLAALGNASGLVLPGARVCLAACLAPVVCCCDLFVGVQAMGMMLCASSMQSMPHVRVSVQSGLSNQAALGTDKVQVHREGNPLPLACPPAGAGHLEGSAARDVMRTLYCMAGLLVHLLMYYLSMVLRPASAGYAVAAFRTSGGHESQPAPSVTWPPLLHGPS